MPGFTFEQHVEAPPAATFAAFADIPNAPAMIPDIVRIELLTPGPVGLGTRFKETRVMFKREATETFAVTEYVPNEAYELTAVSSGAEFRIRFTFAPAGAGTRVGVDLRIRAVKLWAKLFTPVAYLMTGMLRRSVARDVDRMRAAAEGRKRAA